MADIENRLDRRIIHPEGLVQAKTADTIVPVKLIQGRLHPCRAVRLVKGFHQGHNPSPYARIVDVPGFPLHAVIADEGKRLRELIRSALPGKSDPRRGEIRAVKPAENPKVMQRGLPQRAAHRPADLRGYTVGVLVVDKKVREIGMPEIAVEAVRRGVLQQKGGKLIARSAPVVRRHVLVEKSLAETERFTVLKAAE